MQPQEVTMFKGRFFKPCPIHIYKQIHAHQLAKKQVAQLAATGTAINNNGGARSMATVRDAPVLPHLTRTADDKRQRHQYQADISRVEIVNWNVRMIRLSIMPNQPPLRHLPGQYIDLQIPGIDTVGGFTITSPPQTALPRPSPKSDTKVDQASNGNTTYDPYIELAIQHSPKNPPAAYLFQDPATILNAAVTLRVGGNFTYPPATLSRLDFERITNVVFVAGGVGINPIMSMLSAMDAAGPRRIGGMMPRVRVLYSSRREYSKDERTGTPTGQEILFEKRLALLARKWRLSRETDLQHLFFETQGTGDPHQQQHQHQHQFARWQGDGDGVSGSGSGSDLDSPPTANQSSDNVHRYYRRINHEDVVEAIGSETKRKETLVYVCGHPSMTDEFVEFLTELPGLDHSRVLCEKWW